MSQVQQQQATSTEDEDDTPPKPTGGRKPAKLAMQRNGATAESEVLPLPNRRIGPIRESRIKDRPEKVGEKDSSLKIKIELDLEVEVEIYARVKGDVTIGLL